MIFENYEDSISSLLAFMIAISPGLFAWFSGIKLVRYYKADPLLPERLFDYHQSLLKWQIVAMVLTSFWFHWFWILIVMISLIVGYFPIRKSIYNESWNMAQYCLFNVRIFLAFRGFSLLLACTPLLIYRSGAWVAIETVLLSILLLGWLIFELPVFNRVLGAKTLKDIELLERFRTITNRSTIKLPRITVVEFPGGKFANAFALPSILGSEILFSRTLLDELSSEETDAIYAHELAHLEEMDSKFRKRRLLIVCSGIFFTLFTPLYLKYGLGFDKINSLILLFIGACILILVNWLAGHKRQHETNADQRAVDLCGDPIAMEKALTKLHQLARLPRRWDSKTEKFASHPSLATRIRDLQHKPEVQNQINFPVLLFSNDSHSCVAIDNNRIHWFEGLEDSNTSELSELFGRAASTVSLAYQELTELLIKPFSQNRAKLLVNTQKGRKLSFELRSSDIALAQNALNAVDIKISGRTTDETVFNLGILLLTVGLAISGLWGYQMYSLLPIILFALFRPGIYTLAVLSLAVLAKVLIQVSHWEPFDVKDWHILLSALILSISSMFIVGWKKRIAVPIAIGMDLKWLAGILWVGISLEILIFIFSAPKQIAWHYLYLFSSENNVLITYSFALSALVWLVAEKRLRFIFSLLFFTLGMLFLCIQSSYFGRYIVNDPLTVRPAELVWDSKSIKPFKTIQLDQANAATNLKVSPAGDWIAFKSVDRFSYGNSKYQFKKIEGNSSSEITAQDLIFTGKDELLRLYSQSEKRYLQSMQWQDRQWQPIRDWELPVTNIIKLSVDRKTGNWQILGHDHSAELYVLISGNITLDQITIKKFPVRRGQNYYSVPQIFNDGLIATSTDYQNDNSRLKKINLLKQEDQVQELFTTHVFQSINFITGSPVENPYDSILSLIHKNNTFYIGTFHVDHSMFKSMIKIPESIAWNSIHWDGEQMKTATYNGKVLNINFAAKQADLYELIGVSPYSGIDIAGSWVAATNHQENSNQLLLYRLTEE